MTSIWPTGSSAVVYGAASLPTARPAESISCPSADRVEILWQDFFRNPSQWMDVRSIKADPRSPDFKHRNSEDSLWIFDWLNPRWVQEELRRLGVKLPDRSPKVKDGNFSVESIISTVSSNVRSHSRMPDEKDFAQNSDSALPNSNYRTTKEEEQLGGSSATGVTDNVYQKNEEDTRACVALVASLKACADQRDLLGGISLHANVARRGLLETNLIIGGAVVNMYAKCGALSQAQEVFDALPARSLVSWNVLISGYAQNEQGHKALLCFDRMQSEGVLPDEVTVVCVLNACGNVGALDKGQELHAFIIKEGLLDLNIVVGNALVDMYACCQLLWKARSVFSELPLRNEISWTTLITGFVQHGQAEEALSCFELMKLQDFLPTTATCLCILKACAIKGAVDMGQEIHAALVKDGLLENDMVIGTALVDMYAKCGALGEAQKVFHELPVQDVISWGALLDGYAQHADGEEALQCFEEMQERGFSPDGATYICILKASGSIGAAHKGQEIHADIAREGWFGNDAAVANSLVDMYAKCGMLPEAQDVFDELLSHDAIIWNALLAGYAQLGEESIVSNLFNRMISEETEPDFVSFLLLINACSHRGLLSKGQAQFESMIEDFGIAPTLEHLTCMVDLFGRAGQIHEAIALIEEMPVCADMSAMLAILGACQKLGNIPLGSWALGHTLHLNRKDSAAYVCISNLYATFGVQDGEETDEAFSE